MDNSGYIEKEKELQRERKFLRNVMATIPDSLLILDRDLRIKNANRSFYKLFQMKPGGIIGRKIADILGDEDGKLSAKLGGLLGTKDTLENFELHHQSEKLGERILNITARGIIVAEEEEEEEEELVVIRDVTERKRSEEMLRRSEENFRRSMDDSPLGIRIVSAEGEMLYANRAILDIYGYASIEELKTTPRKKSYTPESYAEHQVRKEKRERGEYVPSNYEISIVCKDGEIRHLEVLRKEVLWNGKTQFQVLYNDITERKQAEEALRESKEQLRKMFESVSDGISVIDLSGIITEVNQRAAEIHGFGSKGKLLGRNALELVAPRDHERIATNIRKTLKQGTIRDVEYTLLKADGTEFPGELSTSVLRDASGKAVGHITIVRDVTERKQVEEALKESEARYRALIDLGAQIGEAIVMLWDEEQKEGVQVFFSDTWLQITGYSREELRNMSFFELVLPPNHEASLARHRRKMSGESDPGLFELTIVRKDGSEVPIEITSAHSTYRGKRVNVVYVRDITERKKTEQQLMVNDRLASIGELASGIAHELNNPLTGIIGLSDLLLATDLPEEIKEDLQMINREAHRTAQVVRNLLTFARKHPEEKKPEDLKNVIGLVLELRAYEQRVQNIQVITRFAPDLPQVTANASQLMQVFLNIITNAEYFMIETHGRGTVTITTERVGDFVRATFADDGPGISRETLRKLFAPFFTTKEVGKGTGLGLSICHGIVTEHGGRIWVESKLGKGATFIVELPVSQATAEKEQ